MKADKILVTGAGGYIGSVAVSIYLENGYEVVALDNFSRGYTSPLKLLQKKYTNKKLRFYKVNVGSDLSKILAKEKGIESAIHYAAFCSVNESMQDPSLYFENNTSGTTKFLSSLIKAGIKKVVFSSTCAVYGEAQYVPIDENHPTNPSNPYGESKLSSEKVLKWHSISDPQFNYVAMRYFNVCGATDDGQIGDSKKPSSLLVQNAVRGALGIESFSLTCPKVDTPDKTPIRDYINVVDLNLAHLKALEYLLKGGQSQIINIGTGTGSSVKEIISAVQKVTGKKFQVGKSTPRQGEYAKMIASIKKAKKVLGWEPTHTIEDSINSLVSWYKKNPQGWKY